MTGIDRRDASAGRSARRRVERPELPLVWSLARDTRGISAIEFAVVFPLMLILMLGGSDLVRYVAIVKRVELVATSISEMISQQTPPQGSTVATVSPLDLHFSYDATLTIFPQIMKDAARRGVAWWQDITIDYASILFTKASSACDNQQNQSTCYTASVIWTSTGTVGNNYRACTIPQLPTTSNVPNRLNLPANVFGPGTLIVIDVVYKFTPLFGSKFFPAQTIARSVYVQPRYATQINYSDPNHDGIATSC